MSRSSSATTLRSFSRHGNERSSSFNSPSEWSSRSQQIENQYRNPLHIKARSTIGTAESQNIICAISEARGISPTVGLAFVNISTGETVLSQFCDSQFYVRALNKLEVFQPAEILIFSSHGSPNPKSKMYMIIEENLPTSRLITIDRKYWSETAGLDYINKLAFCEDVEALKVAVAGNYFATCCFAAAIKYVELSMSLTFCNHSLRVKYQASEGTMMIDLSTVQSLELIQNIQDSRSKDCLFGLLNETLTPMGARLLKSNILQPSTQSDVLIQRYQALEELISKEDIFVQTRQGWTYSHRMFIFPDQFVEAIPPIREALGDAQFDLLSTIREHCQHSNINPTLELIQEVINEDVTYQKTPLDLRHQRTYAVKSGVSGLLDVARQTFKEATEDVHQHISDLNQLHEMNAELRYDNSRHYYFRVLERDFDSRSLPENLINRYRKKGYIECQTLDLVKLNQRIEDSHQEIVLMSDKTVQELVNKVRKEIPVLFRVCESIAMLDMISGFGQLATTNDYIRPEITDCIAIKSARHPVREKVHPEKFIPNDIYASLQKRFQIITGCNMSGKSTYIRSIALMAIMAQIGCFVPASYASFPLVSKLFARVSIDDNHDANVSTFASEMRETSFILRNIDENSLVIFDELGRGTSSRDGLAIAISISEALIESRALIWFATHFRELAQVLSERPGVVNLHLEVEMNENTTLMMLYKIGEGYVEEGNYGLSFAKIVDLPSLVLEVAEDVSKTLSAQAEARKKSSKAVAIARRRKLILGLKETLKQAERGSMCGTALLSWLRKLQEEFVHRMNDIEDHANASDSQNDLSSDEEPFTDTEIDTYFGI